MPAGESFPDGPWLTGIMMTDPAKTHLPKVLAFVDESGDRNCDPNRQSDYFTMTAVLVAEEHQDDLKIAVGGLKSLWGIKKELHWVDHTRGAKASRKDRIAQILGQLPLTIVHVVLDKTAVWEDSALRTQQSVQYNFATRYLAERIVTAAADWPGGERIAQVMFGLVGGVDDNRTRAYLNHVAAHTTNVPVPWTNMLWQPVWRPMHAHLGLQAADAYSGMLMAAVRYDDPTWLIATKHQLWRWRGQIYQRGIKTMPTDRLLIHRPWWTDAMRAK